MTWYIDRQRDWAKQLWHLHTSCSLHNQNTWVSRQMLRKGTWVRRQDFT
jgi:hypothetical protein